MILSLQHQTVKNEKSLTTISAKTARSKAVHQLMNKLIFINVYSYKWRKRKFNVPSFESVL